VTGAGKLRSDSSRSAAKAAATTPSGGVRVGRHAPTVLLEAVMVPAQNTDHLPQSGPSACAAPLCCHLTDGRAVACCQSAAGGGHLESDALVSLTFETSRPFSLHRLQDFLALQLPDDVLRIKARDDRTCTSSPARRTSGLFARCRSIVVGSYSCKFEPPVAASNPITHGGEP
jgi:hypothetical protein